MVTLHAPLSEGFLTQDRADELAADGLFADDPAGFAAAWPEVCARWDGAVAAGAASELGIDLDAAPTLDEVLEVRGHHRTIVRQVIAEQTDGSLSRTCAPREGRFQVVGALQVVVHEEWDHLQFADRDLADLEARPAR